MLSGFSLKEKIQENANTLIYRASKEGANENTFIVKLLVSEYPTTKELSNLQQEFDLTKSLDLPGVVKALELLRHGNGLGLVLADVGGISLKDAIKDGKLSIQRFFEIALSLTDTLRQIHEQGVIHKDIKPGNIIVSQSGQVFITDFGLSTRLSQEKARYAATSVMEGTLSYIAPEQTGRMNRSIDHRSDLYSLGVTFYELLTGKLPFETSDAMELVHSHIAKIATSPHDIDPNVPEQLSKIVMKLMSKTAEDRYQSSAGLLFDLQRCNKEFKEFGKISSFPLGEEDLSGRFQIPQKLYGRETETNTLLSAFERVGLGNSELLLVSGYSGVGKSSLVHEVHRPITEKKGLFIAGKFDQFQRDIPYYAIRLALKDFCEYLATESEEVLNEWKQKILTAIEGNGQVLVDIVPDLELIIGKQPPVPELSSQESQNRLNSVFLNFISTIAKPEHPLVMFIDDLQWADSGSLRLIKLLLTGELVRNFLLIGAFRDNEVDAAHAFVMTLDEIRKEGCIINTIKLEPLASEDVGNLISDSLGTTKAASYELSDLVYSKTGGNAFFVNEFFKNLYEEGLLHFDFQARKWKWDIGKIEAKNVTGNVIELMSQKIARMPEDTKVILEFASCVGNKFSLKILSIIFEDSEKVTLSKLWKAVEEGLIIPLDHNYKIFQGEDRKIDAKVTDGSGGKSHLEQQLHDAHFQFLHDRVQEAAYSQIEESQKKQVHLKIGRLLLERTDSEELPEQIFSIVNQFNLGKDLIEEAEEQLKLCELNLFAGQKARLSNAYGSAVMFLGNGIELLPIEPWKHHYKLAFSLYSEKASCEYSAAILDECEKDIKVALANAVGQDDKTKVYTLYLSLLFQLSRHHEGIKVGREALAFLGLKVPKKVNKGHVTWQYIRFKIALGRRKADDILELKEIQDKRIFNICSVIFDLVPSSYHAEPDLMGYASLIMAIYCLRYGNSIYAPFAYAMAGVIMSGVTKELESGYKFMKMGEALTHKFYDIGVKARVTFLIANFSMHWQRPIQEHPEVRDTAFKYSIEAGNINWADYCWNHSRAQSIFFNENSLQRILEDNEKVYNIHLKHKDRQVILSQYFILNFINSMMLRKNECPNVCNYDAEAYAKEILTEPSATVRVYFYYFNMVSEFTKENWNSALGYGWKGFIILHEVLGFMVDFFHRYYYVLSILAGELYGDKKPGLKHRMTFGMNRFLIKYYCKKNPANYLSHNLLISALEAQRNSKPEAALKFFESAIEKAHDSGFILNEALANEFAAKFYIAEGSDRGASAYMTEAHYLYAKWGHAQKVLQLEEKYGEYIRRGSPSVTQSISESIVGQMTTTVATSTGGGVSGTLDLSTVLKASQAISGEIRLDKLLSELLYNLIENTGAERGLLVLEKNNELVIEAEGDTEGNLSVLKSEKVQGSKKVPHAIMNYVMRSKQPLVLGRATQDGQFQKDPYVVEEKPQSIICSPIIHQGRLTGLVYLENRLAADAFTPERLQMVKVLSAQAAISLENSTLYENLEGKVKERTAELSVALSKVQELKLQQDADYFLTSLLLEPLGVDKTDSENVNIEFFMRQKKHFTYKNSEHTIGGDICGANNITLKGKKYTVFMNADAMGKSIQGAAGALITGSVFESIIQRTILSDYWQGFAPEIWIRNSFIELQKVFENLDGAMLISILIGIIDEASGTMYTINSDYPPPILYRKGKAAYLPPSHRFLKLGVSPSLFARSGNRGGDHYHYLSIDVHPLLDGDILITGSDGKDDINTGIDEDGMPIKVQDEEFILTLIEKSDGNLEKLYELVRGAGEITDDLSLMKLEYSRSAAKKVLQTPEIKVDLENFQRMKKQGNLIGAISELKNAYKHGYEDAYVFRTLARLFYQEKDYKAAAHYASKYFDNDPADNSNMFLLSLACFRNGNLDRARSISECLILRKSDDVEYLSHYAEVLLALGNMQYEQFLHRAEQLDSNAPTVQRIKKKLMKIAS
ncbi:histidine kinase [Leptospira perolatii]|uniref:Histidine kinase n=1 Tax=Leptospira perolatii TaxID=2023191 RepID=A0A2M9ZQI4_9LEPT|nr:AAA family ATPase [Leptospira perolatii]PJZ70504.1 histidine kinase [Leptospira perolatii]PJZ74340.1 histidine kinase [Leptospira perolatii]